MIPVEKNEKLLCEYGRSVVRINAVEFLLTEVIAMEYIRRGDTISNEERLAKISVLTLGQKINIFRTEFLNKPDEESIKYVLDLLEKINYERIALTHVMSAELGDVNSEKKWEGKGEYVIIEHSRKIKEGRIQKFPVTPLSLERLDHIVNSTKEAVKLLYKYMMRGTEFEFERLEYEA